MQIASLLEFNCFWQFSKQLLTALISFTLKTVSFVILDNNYPTSKSTLILTGSVLCGTHQSSFKKIVKKKHVKSSQNFVMSNGDAICIVIFLMATKLLERLNYQLKKIVSWEVSLWSHSLRDYSLNRRLRTWSILEPVRQKFAS